MIPQLLPIIDQHRSSEAAGLLAQPARRPRAPPAGHSLIPMMKLRLAARSIWSICRAAELKAFAPMATSSSGDDDAARAHCLRAVER
jgi:hypothetical protein